MMDLPDEFHTFSNMFHADIYLYDDPVGEAMVDGLGPLTEEGKENLKKFFEDILKRDFTDEELELLWTKSSADIRLTARGSRRLLKEALEILSSTG